MNQAAKRIEELQNMAQARPQYAYNWRVLIVEDEPAIAEGIKAILVPSPDVIPITRSSRSSRSGASGSAGSDYRKDQFEVVWAKNPTEAIRHVKESVESNRPFAFGFFDVMLGGEIDGIELLRQVQQLDSKIYAVFVTAYHDRSVDSINQILGHDKSDRWDYINKPFTDGSILQKARNAVSIWNLKEEKRIQDDQLAEAQHLLLQGERTNTVAAVGRSVAHEFGNLLMHIIGHAEIALLKETPPEMKQALTTILKAGETAASVLDKYKKINVHSDPSAEPEQISVNQCMDEAIELMAHEFKKRSIRIQRGIIENCQLGANYHSLTQVFINLFTNASHAMSPDGGQIDVSLKMSKDDQSQLPDSLAYSWVEIRIRDHGPGIPEDVLPKVMNPFFTTKGAQGTGLGLAICKDIVEAEHFGDFNIQNHPDQGVEILIRLPERRGVS